MLQIRIIVGYLRKLTLFHHTKQLPNEIHISIKGDKVEADPDFYVALIVNVLT